MGFKIGEGEIIPGLEEALIGMKEGEEKEIKIPPEQAYGNRNPELMKQIPRKSLPKDKKIEAGMMLVMTAPNGMQMPAVIKEVSEKEITLDLNHPLAGKTLNFKIKIVDIS